MAWNNRPYNPPPYGCDWDAHRDEMHYLQQQDQLTAEANSRLMRGDLGGFFTTAIQAGAAQSRANEAYMRGVTNSGGLGSLLGVNLGSSHHPGARGHYPGVGGHYHGVGGHYPGVGGLYPPPPPPLHSMMGGPYQSGGQLIPPPPPAPLQQQYQHQHQHQHQHQQQMPQPPPYQQHPGGGGNELPPPPPPYSTKP